MSKTIDLYDAEGKRVTLTVCGDCKCLVTDKEAHDAVVHVLEEQFATIEQHHNLPTHVVPMGGSAITTADYGIEFDDTSADDDYYDNLADAKTEFGRIYEDSLLPDADPDDFTGMRLMVRQRTVILGPWVPYVPKTAGEGL